MSAGAPLRDPGVPPLVCPFCGATQIPTSTEPVRETAYLRCRTCGEIWNPARLVLPRYRPR